MPALITHHLFGEESIDRLPQGVITSDEERIAFILGNQEIGRASCRERV